jgi:hypothetical protein
MKLSSATFALVLVFAATERATGFSLTAAVSKKGTQLHAFGSTPTRTAFVHPHLEVSNKKKTLLYGILDDISAESSSVEDDQEKSDNQAYEQLFEDLVFSTRDSKTVIAEQLEACTDTGFVQYLENMETESGDDDERQALRELLGAIDDVVKTSAIEAAAAALAKEEQKEAKRQKLADEANTAPKPKMTNAEVLKRANAIDEAVVSAEVSEDELPPDFIRDAKKEVGLAGFNNKGQLRVGGN